jgi:hypothetical protein
MEMDYGWIMDGLWMDYGWIMDGLWMDYGWIMDGLWMDWLIGLLLSFLFLLLAAGFALYS